MHLLRTSAAGLSWTGLIWNKYVNPQLAAFSWRLLHRKTPIDFMAKNKGCSMASGCHNCHLSEESNYHLLCSCNMVNALWSWLLAPCGSTLPAPTSAVAIWEVVSLGGDASGRQLVAAVFFHAICILWLFRNDPKHNGRKSTIECAEVIFCR